MRIDPTFRNISFSARDPLKDGDPSLLQLVRFRIDEIRRGKTVLRDHYRLFFSI